MNTTFKKNCYLPYHIVNQTNDRNFYEKERQPIIWKIYVSALQTVSWAYGAKIHSFVLMNNHYHMLLSTPDGNLPQIIQYFQREVSKTVKDITKSQKFRFTGAYKASLIMNASYFSNAYRYVYQNPLRHSLSTQCESYLYSTLHGKMGQGRLEIPLYPCEPFQGILPEDVNDYLTFLNTVISGDDLVKIQRAVRRSIFTPPIRIRKM